jgi:hypothetical protein
VEVAVLTKLFDDLIPVALDLYAVYLVGSMEDYECILLRGLELFMQLGKHHYVSVVLRFAATVQHWREKHPALYECFSKSMHCWTEEPVELFHASVRHIAEKQRTSMALADAINTHAVLKENLAEWVQELGGGIDSGGLCVDHIPAAAEKMSTAIGTLFKRVLGSSGRCVFDEDEGVWRSQALGKFDDRCLPIALQHSVTVYGFTNLDVNVIKVHHDGFLDVGSVGRCGHHCSYADQNSVCRACTGLIAFVSKQCFEMSPV